jgi:hypothetical protein
MKSEAAAGGLAFLAARFEQSWHGFAFDKHLQVLAVLMQRNWILSSVVFIIESFSRLGAGLQGICKSGCRTYTTVRSHLAFSKDERSMRILRILVKLG